MEPCRWPWKRLSGARILVGEMITEAEYTILSSLEKKVVDWLTKNNVLFSSQEPMFGGSRELGGAIIDVVLTERNIVLRILGGYWHSSLGSKARDEFGREQLIGRGYVVVDLHEENLTDDRIENTMQLAMRGEEALR